MANPSAPNVKRIGAVRGYRRSMLRSSIHLIGGGPGTLTSLRSHLRMALPPGVRGKKPLVAYVGAASGDDAGFQRMIGDELVRAGGRVKGVKLASPRAKVSAATALLEDCDAVFVSGGDVAAGMAVLEQRDVLPLFRRLGEQGKPMIGISAGSIMLARAWVRFPDDPTHGAPAVFPCMSIAPVYVDAHAEEDRWSELRTLLELLGEAAEPRPVGYGLTRKGGILIQPTGRGATVAPFGTDTPKFTLKNRRATVSPALRLGSVDAVPLTAPPRRRAVRG
jgi:peptidase E